MDPRERYMDALEDEMRRAIASLGDGPPLLYGMINYHLGWADEHLKPASVNSGKRVRPTLLLLSTEAQGGPWRAALPAAAAVELLHNFTLIHDDIEDRDEERRGRTTLWKVWGVPQAINAGDALFAMAYRSLLNLRSHDVPPERQVEVVSRYTEAVIRITEGQCMDLAFESQDIVDEAAYLRMIAGKTAALLGLACELGVLIAGAPADAVRAMREFGEAIGKAFQMRDDFLGLWGNQAVTGKPVGSDLRKRKKTLPILHGMAASPALRDLLLSPDFGPDDVNKALELLELSDSHHHTEAKARAFHREAMDALSRSQGSGEAHEAVRHLAQRLLDRRH